MKTCITFLAIFICLIVKAQEVDSAWIAANFMPGFTRDTGSVRPGSIFYDEKGNERTLAEFRGKILYVDIWTTWCAPCIGNFPFSKQLAKRLKNIHLDTAIQFINICTEETRSEWKKKLKQHHPAGLNLYSKDTAIYQTMQIVKFPTYLLLDREGKLLAADFLSPDDGFTDYALFAATENVPPATSVWIQLRQSQHFQKYLKFTDDAEGRAYEKWYKSTVNDLIQYFQWRQQQLTKKSR